MGKMKKWMTIVFIVAVVVYLAVVALWGNVAKAPIPEFKGPTGQPYIKGPSGPPPGAN